MLHRQIMHARSLVKDDPNAALVQAHEILAQYPGFPVALRIAAAAHRQLNHVDEAHAAEVAAIHHSQRNPLLVRAVDALNRGDAGEASQLTAQLLQAEPDDLAALTLSAESALAFGLGKEAEDLLRIVRDRAPSFLAASSLLINALMLQDKLREALALADELVARQPNDATLLRLRARLLGDLGDYANSAAAIEQVLRQSPRAADAWVQLGDARRFMGMKEDAQSAYRAAIQHQPTYGLAWWSLATHDPSAISPLDMDAMRDALEARAGYPEDAGNLHFALATIYDRQRSYADAFRHFEQGNRLRLAAQPYDPAELSAMVDDQISNLGGNSIPPRGPVAEPTPIFIVGMPRAGSTLLERIVGRHSDVEALGELPILPHLVERLRKKRPAETIGAIAASLNGKASDQFALAYLERAAERRRDTVSWFTDKLHMNWRHLPFALRAMPQAIVIDIRRSALDCCWSNYKTLFARGHPAASDLGNIAAFYRDYVRLTDHLAAIAPDRVYQLEFEQLVDDPERIVRDLCTFIGIDFDPEMLNFHRSSTPVATASSEQVRRPMNRDGIGAWRNYEAWLGPLQDRLAPPPVE